MNTNWFSPSVRIPVILFRVVCGFDDTIVIFSPTIAFNSVDLPTLGRPRIAINPVLALSCFGIFLVIVAITKYVSLGAIVGISMSPIMMIFTKNSKGLIATLFLTVSVIYTHRENIKRLLSGTERKLGEKK